MDFYRTIDLFTFVKLEDFLSEVSGVKADSDGFCGFQKMPKESGIIHGSEEVQLMRTGCETPRFPYI